MKGLKLNTRILTVTAIVFGILMASLGVYESWSKHHLTNLDPLFYVCMVSIVITFMTASFSHKDFRLEMGRIFSTEVRLEHLLRINSYLFALVVVFGVNNHEEWIQVLHFVFTIAAILMGYITMILYYKRDGSRQLEMVAYFVIGAGAMFLGIIHNDFSLSWGEVIAALPLAGWIYFTID